MTLSTKQLCILSLLIVLSAVNTCAYTPAIPLISSYFQQSMSKTQGLIVISLMAHAFGPLTFAALGNGLSRYHAVRIGLWICLLGDFFCLISAPTHQFKWLMLGMFSLSFGGNMGMTMALTLIRDQRGALLEKPISLAMISFAILPGLAITIVGTLLKFSPWSSAFIALTVYHILLWINTSNPIFSQALLPNSYSVEKKFSRIISLQPLLQMHFWKLVIMAGSLSGMIYTFSALAPKIAIHELGLSTLSFGLWSNVPSLGMLIGNLCALRFVGKKLSRAMAYAIIIQVFAIFILWISIKTHQFHVGIFFEAIALAFMGGSLAFPLITAKLLKQSENHASTAALFTMLHFLIASQWVNLGNHLTFSSVQNLLIVYSGSVTLFSLLCLYRDRIHFNQSISR